MKNKSTTLKTTALCILTLTAFHAHGSDAAPLKPENLDRQPPAGSEEAILLERQRIISTTLCMGLTAGNNHALPTQILQQLAISTVRAISTASLGLEPKELRAVSEFFKSEPLTRLAEMFNFAKQVHRDYQTRLEQEVKKQEADLQSAREELALLNGQFPLCQDQTLTEK